MYRKPFGPGAISGLIQGAAGRTRSRPPATRPPRQTPDPLAGNPISLGGNAIPRQTTPFSARNKRNNNLLDTIQHRWEDSAAADRRSPERSRLGTQRRGETTSAFPRRRAVATVLL
jgi:hypothetical protein